VVARPRVVVALLTPFESGGRVDVAALRAHVDWLVEAGVDGLMPAGTTGEGPLLSDLEVGEVVGATVDAAAGRVPVLAHVGRPGTSETIMLATRAWAAGADAVSAVTPYYYALGDDQVRRHYAALIADAGGDPVYAYTIPARTGNELSTAVVRALAADGLAGVKDSTKSWERHVEYLACDVPVLIGTDGMVRRAFAAGAAGCVSALANVRPDLLCALRDGGGEEVEAEVLQLRGELPMGALKAAVAARLAGYPTAYRAPLG
jgi:dihydrodipicolinate synthase/N-acetylneuraminate lyase